MSAVGKLLKSVRKTRSLSQVDFAKALGISTVFLWKIETGLNRLPMKHVTRIIDVLDVTRKDLLSAMSYDMHEKFEEKAQLERKKERQT